CPFSSTIRTEGIALGVAVASAMALASLGSLAQASAYQASKRTKGSPCGITSANCSASTGASDPVHAAGTRLSKRPGALPGNRAGGARHNAPGAGRKAPLVVTAIGT